MKTPELTGELLNHLVAKALGWEQKLWGAIPVWFDPQNENRFRCNVAHWKPSENWAQGGPIIEREEIKVSLLHEFTKDTFFLKGWVAVGCDKDGYSKGETPLIAAMRCFVASKFGDEVPEE